MHAEIIIKNTTRKLKAASVRLLIGIVEWIVDLGVRRLLYKPADTPAVAAIAAVSETGTVAQAGTVADIGAVAEARAIAISQIGAVAISGAVAGAVAGLEVGGSVVVHMTRREIESHRPVGR